MLAEIKVNLVESVDNAAAFLRWLGERRPILAVDTETTGLKWWTSNFLRLVQFGDGVTGWSVSARNWRGVIVQALDAYEGPIVMHNAKFDVHALASDGIASSGGWSALHDTKLMHSLLDPLSGHSLKPIAEKMFGREATVGQGILRQAFAKNGWTWATVPENYSGYWSYAALDTVLTAKIAEALWPELNSRTGLRDAYEREMAVQSILYQAEVRGLRVDVPYTRALTDEWVGEMAELTATLDTFGVSNPNARAQIIKALEAELAWEPGEFTATGEPKVDEPVLRALPGEVAPAVLRYRRLRKWSSAYLQHFICERDDNDRVHASINTMAARTGRMSITEPPLQTLPRGTEIRDCIIPSDDRRLLAVDFDTMELRALASFAGEQGLIDAFLQGKDLHTYAASEVYGIPESDVSAHQRQITKNTQYGLVYGAGPKKLAQTANVTEETAKQFVAMYEKTFPGVRAFMRQLELVARTRLQDEGEPYIRTSGGRRVPSEPDKLYALVNYLIQGSCADIFKQKIVDLDASGLADLLLLPVHDELLFDVPTEDWDEFVPAVEETMTEHGFAVPLTVHASHPLTRWGDAYRAPVVALPGPADRETDYDARGAT